MKDNKWIEFHELPNPNKKTRKIAVWSKSINIELGMIMWYGAWRQYAFFPDTATIWNKGCLESVNEKIDEMMKERKA